MIGKSAGKPIECKKTCGKVDVPTDQEVAALNALRAIKERVRAVKKMMDELSSQRGAELKDELLVMEKEMAELKTKWVEWEEKRRQAARERMILLGHESLT